MNDTSEILFKKLGTITYTITQLEIQLESLYKDRDAIYRSINDHFKRNSNDLDRTAGSTEGEQKNETI